MLDILSLDELERLAKERLPQMAFDYIAGGSDDEWTLRENRAAFNRLRLIPRVLADVAEIRLTTTVLGKTLSMPVLIGPTAFHRLAHDEGELATARAAAAAGTILVAAMMSNQSLEAIAATVRAPRWFQLYMGRDRELTRSLVQRAVEASYDALCVTVDVPLLGRRTRDMRNRFTLPDGLEIANLKGTDVDVLPETAAGSRLDAYVAAQGSAGLTWKEIDWLHGLSSLPLVLKGIMSPEDARLAVEHGAAAIVVSNHGGRQLDTAPATITVLPDIADAVRGQIEVLVDGGIRRGTDVLKALALGARAVLLGRPILWGLALDGEAGVRAVLELIRAELEVALTLTGCSSVENVSRALLWGGEKI